MYPRIVTRRRGKKTYRYLHIVESYREGTKVKQRTLASLGNVERFTEADIDGLIDGLCRVFDRPSPGDQQAVEVEFTEARSFGGVFVLLQLWKQLRLTQTLAILAAQSGHSFDVVEHVKLMVINRALDPRSKLALLDWLEEVHIPGLSPGQVQYHHLLRSMDWLLRHKLDIEAQLASDVLELFDQKLELVFWDVTSTYFETSETDELRQHGYSRDSRPDRPQAVIGVVMTSDGFPVHHQVFPGSTSDVSTVCEVAEALKERFPISNLVLVGDRGMLSDDNRRELEKAGLGYIMAHRLRNRRDAKRVHAEHADVFKRWSRLSKQGVRQAEEAENGKRERDEMDDIEERIEVQLGDADDHDEAPRRGIVSYSQQVGASSRRGRHLRLEDARRQLDAIDAKLLDQDRDVPIRGRALSEDGALLKAAEVLRRKRCRGLLEIGIDPDDGIFFYKDKQAAQQWEDAIDGVLLLETSLTPEQAPAAEVERQYRNLQDLERCFRTMKHSLGLRPVYHWTDKRIRCHVFICVLALALLRVMRARLGTGTHLRGQRKRHSPESALRTMGRMMRVTARVGGKSVEGLTTATPDQRQILELLQLPHPDRRHLSGGA